MNTFRNYDNSEYQERVEKTYKKMIENQTLEYVLNMKINYAKYPNLKKTIWEVIKLLETIIDESDPDTDESQLVHACQTTALIICKYFQYGSTMLKTDIDIKNLFTELEWHHLPLDVKKMYPKYLHELYSDIDDWGWFPITGFIHDLGKVLMIKEFGGLEQWSVVGDTFPVGCRFIHKNIFYHKKFHHNNPDYGKYDTYGIYKSNCGFNKIHMSYGHDEYLASVLEINNTKLPKEAIYIIRFHSFYAWHSPKNSYLRGYSHLANDYDWKMLPLLKAFQKTDLYSKKNSNSDNIEQLKIIFNPLIEKYIGNKELVW